MVKKRTATASAPASSPSTPASHLPPHDGDHGDQLPDHDLASLSRPSRGGSSATPAPLREERSVAKQGAIVTGSGDGAGFGDECFMWTDLPMNQRGYRYVPCTLSPTVSPSSTYPFYRTIPGPPQASPVHISWLDRSQFLRVSPNALTCSTDRGYRSGRASVSVREGIWYYEAIIERGDGATGSGRGTGGDTGNAHVRLGWARREAGLDAPVGADAYGYGVRDVGGEKVHISRPKPYGRTFATGDVVGCLISLPPRSPAASEDDPAYVRRWRVPVPYKGQVYFEMDEYPAVKEMEALVNREGLPPAPTVPDEPEPKKKVKKHTTAEPPRPVTRQLTTLPGSYISFYLNGEPLGTAFSDVYDFLPLPALPGQLRKQANSYDRERARFHDDGTLGYFPMVSCFGRGKVRCNFGPDWEAPPRDLPDGTRALVERWERFRAEELAYDERDEAALTERILREMEAAAAAPPPPTNGASTPGHADALSRRNKKRKKATPAPGEASATGTPAPGYTPADTPAADTPTATEPIQFSSPQRAPSSTPGLGDMPWGEGIKNDMTPTLGDSAPPSESPFVKAEPGAEDEHEGVVW